MNRQNKLAFIAMILCLLMIFYNIWQFNNKFNEIYKFVKTYKIYDSFNKQIIQDTIRDFLQEFTIKGNWIISIDPNNNWIRFQYDPNCIKLKIKEE
ncbi:MAG: hypothetical protein ACFE9S_07480 [Candidatus Hermodarchaeota archaeon]